MDSTFVDNMAPLTQPANFFHRLKTYFLNSQHKVAAKKNLYAGNNFSLPGCLVANGGGKKFSDTIFNFSC